MSKKTKKVKPEPKKKVEPKPQQFWYDHNKKK